MVHISDKEYKYMSAVTRAAQEYFADAKEDGMYKCKALQDFGKVVYPDPPRRSPTGEQLVEIYRGPCGVGSVEGSLKRVQHHILTELRKDIAKEQERLSGFGWELWNVVDKVLQRWLKENE